MSLPARVTVAVCLGLALWPSPVLADHHHVNPPWPQLLPPRPLAYSHEPEHIPGCPKPNVDCVRRVISDMSARWDPLDGSCDFRAVFALTYLRTTEGYLRALQEGRPAFDDRRWMILLDVRFAHLYFSAFDAYQRGDRQDVPRAWQMAFDAATDKETWAGQDLFLGMNAHINRDLPVALWQMGLVAPDGSSHKPDHDRVNAILTRVLDPVQDEIAARYDPLIGMLDLSPSPADEVGALEMLESWREVAWRNAERLAGARSAVGRARVMASIERYASTWARVIRAGRIPGYPPRRDAYCRSRGRP